MAAAYSGKSKTESTPGSIPSQPARPPWKKLRSAASVIQASPTARIAGVRGLDPPTPVPPERAVGHRVRVEPDAVGLEERGPPERLLDRVSARAGVAQVQVGQDAGEPAVGHAATVGLSRMRVGQRLEPEGADGRAVDRPVEPVVGRRAGEPSVLRAGVAEDVVLDHLQAEPVGLVHQRAIVCQRAEPGVGVVEVDRGCSRGSRRTAAACPRWSRRTTSSTAGRSGSARSP